MTLSWYCSKTGAARRRLGERLWKKDCQACILNREDAVDCNRWRKLIRDDW